MNTLPMIVITVILCLDIGGTIYLLNDAKKFNATLKYVKPISPWPYIGIMWAGGLFGIAIQLPPLFM